MAQFVSWEFIPILIITVLLAMIKGSGGNVIGSFIIAFVAYLIIKIPVLLVLGGIPNPNPQHHLIAAIISTLICGGFAVFAILRSRNANIPPLHKLFSKR